MSGKIAGMVFSHYPGRGNELLLAVKLADNAHDDGCHIFPSVRTLAEDTRQSERSVQYLIKHMLAMGWLVLVREARGGGRGAGSGRPREYRINPAWIRAHDSKVPDADRPKWTPRVSPKMGAKVAPISSAKKQKHLEMGAIAVAEMGAIAVAPDPSLTVINTKPPYPPSGGERVADATSSPGTGGGFDEVWSIWPKKVDQKNAQRAWANLAPDRQLQGEIAQAIHAWSRSPEWQADNGRWIPRLSKWLRGKRWRDETGTAAPPARPEPPRQPSEPLSPQALATNRQRAQEAAALARAVLGKPRRNQPLTEPATAGGEP